MKRRRFVKSAAIGALGISQLNAPVGSEENRGSINDSLRSDILVWTEQVRYKDDGWGRWKYSTAMGRPYALESSSFVLNILDKLGALDRVSQKQKLEAIDFFLSCIDPVDGLMKDPLVKEEDRVREGHTWEHIWAHMHSVGSSGLKRLGYHDLPRLKKAPFADLNNVDAAEWLLSLPWENPWLQGEHMARVVKWYWEQLPKEKQNLQEPRIKALFDTFEKHVLDPDTGMPIKRGCKNRNHAMAGAFKVYRAYLTVGKKIPYPERALDFVLDLQRTDGGFGDGEGDMPMTIQWDSMWDLWTLNKQLHRSYRFEDLVQAGNRHQDFLMKNHRKPDGAFSFFPKTCQYIHNSIYLSEKHPVSDAQGTTMCLNCMEYVDEWNS